VKSHAREESIVQMKMLLARFREFFPEHRDKRLYGILAAVDLSAALRARALREGLYVARIHDEIFEIDVPADFQPIAH
jgi:RecB family endonuclease NucS